MKHLLFLSIIVLAFTIYCARAYTKKFDIVEERISNDLGGWRFIYNVFAYEDVLEKYEKLNEYDTFNFWIQAKYLKSKKQTNVTDIFIDSLLYMTMLPGNKQLTWFLDNVFLVYSSKEFDLKSFHFRNTEGKETIYIPDSVDTLVLEFNTKVINKIDSTIIIERPCRYKLIRKESSRIAPYFKFMVN